jgi:hypothetical protein
MAHLLAVDLLAAGKDAKATASKAAKAVKKNIKKKTLKPRYSVVFHRPKTLKRTRDPKYTKKRCVCCAGYLSCCCRAAVCWWRAGVQDLKPWGNSMCARSSCVLWRQQRQQQQPPGDISICSSSGSSSS